MYVRVFKYLCFVYLSVSECEGVWVFEQKCVGGNVSVNVDYSFLTMHLNVLGLFFFSQMYIHMYVTVRGYLYVN